MTLLLDTHAFLWFVTDDPRLSDRARNLISDAINMVCISPATYWQVAIKVSIGKYPMTVPFERFFRDALDGNDVRILPVELRHAATLTNLPMHHKDPFDRMLIAQAVADRLPIVTVDDAFAAYEVFTLF